MIATRLKSLDARTTEPLLSSCGPSAGRDSRLDPDGSPPLACRRLDGVHPIRFTVRAPGAKAGIRASFERRSGGAGSFSAVPGGVCIDVDRVVERAVAAPRSRRKPPGTSAAGCTRRPCCGGPSWDRPAGQPHRRSRSAPPRHPQAGAGDAPRGQAAPGGSTSAIYPFSAENFFTRPASIGRSGSARGLMRLPRELSLVLRRA